MKLIIKPNLWGVGLDLFEFDLTNVIDNLGYRSDIPLNKISEEIKSLFNTIVSDIAKDRYTEGPSTGGWGKDYRDRYYNDMFPDCLPSDLSKSPDSITWTAVALDGLRCLYDTSQIDQAIEMQILFDSIFKDSRKYLDKRYSIGEAGLYISTAGGEGVIAKNLRHTATASFAWLRVEKGEERLLSLVSTLARKLSTGYPYVIERAFSIGCILGSLYLTKNIQLLKSNIPITDEQLDSIIGTAEFALLKKFDPKHCLWLDNKELEILSLGYALWILKFSFQLGNTTNNRILSMYESVMSTLVDKWLVDIDGTKGIPAVPNGPVDVGATSLLLELLPKIWTMQ